MDMVRSTLLVNDRVRTGMGRWTAVEEAHFHHVVFLGRNNSVGGRGKSSEQKEDARRIRKGGSKLHD